MDIHDPSCAPFGPEEEVQPENKKHKPQLQPFKWPSSTQPNSTSAPPGDTAHGTCFLAVPCPVSKRSTISDTKDEDKWSSPFSSPEHRREEDNSPMHLLYTIFVGCECQETGQESLRCASAKIQIICVQGAKQAHHSPVQRRAVLACPGLKAQGKSWCCDPLLNRWMVTRWNRLSGETAQFPAPEVSEVSSSPIAQWIYNSSFRERVKTLPQLSKQHAKDKLLFLHIFPLSRRENKTWGGNAQRKEFSISPQLYSVQTIKLCTCLFISQKMHVKI